VVSQLLTGITVGERRQRVIRQVQHRLDLTEIDQLVQSYREGAGVKELATMFGISRQTVSDHLDRAAVERRRRGLTEKEILKAAVLYGEGWSLKRLGDRFGIDAETVRQALLKGGVQMRPRNGWAKSRQQI
jgi:DNA-directed RNA polymerase specialized sigma24 family protein